MYCGYYRYREIRRTILDSENRLSITIEIFIYGYQLLVDTYQYMLIITFDVSCLFINILRRNIEINYYHPSEA